MEGIDWFVLATYVLMITTFISKFRTRRGMASIAGYTILIVAKQLEIAKASSSRTIDVLRRAGYATLLFSPSYEHWYDSFGVVGYVMALLGESERSAPFMALYHTSGLPSASGTYFVAKACAALVFAFGYKNPLM